MVGAKTKACIVSTRDGRSTQGNSGMDFIARHLLNSNEPLIRDCMRLHQLACYLRLFYFDERDGRITKSTCLLEHIRTWLNGPVTAVLITLSVAATIGTIKSLTRPN